MALNTKNNWLRILCSVIQIVLFYFQMTFAEKIYSDWWVNSSDVSYFFVNLIASGINMMFISYLFEIKGRGKNILYFIALNFPGFCIMFLVVLFIVNTLLGNGLSV